MNKSGSKKENQLTGSVGGARDFVTKALKNCDLTQTNLQSVAAEYGTSPRSLRRWLMNEGTSFRELVNEEKRLRLGDVGGRPIDNHAYFGYSSAASFRRRYKDWAPCN